MNKICTTIEQSQKLIELGININTADIWWNCRGAICAPLMYCEYPTCEKRTEKDIPAWSLAALLGLMILINEYNIEYRPIIERYRNDGWVCKYYNEETRNTNDIYVRRYGKTSLDVAFQMICWLLENNKL